MSSLNPQPHYPAGSRRGFTLVEMLFTLGIGSLILTGVLTSYIISVRGFRGLSNYIEMEASRRQSLDWFARDRILQFRLKAIVLLARQGLRGTRFAVT